MTASLALQTLLSIKPYAEQFRVVSIRTQMLRMFRSAEYSA